VSACLAGMASSLGAESGGRNVEINIVPFIDLMSCLTAFLLFTAVWAHEAQLDVHAAGRGPEPMVSVDHPQLSVLIDADAVWIGEAPLSEFDKVPRLPGGHDWARVEQLLRAHKASPEFVNWPRIEVAATSTADDPVSYSELVAVMDSAIKVGFNDVIVTEASGLSAQPQL
jgi:biopolymer transport protein TolR